MLACRLSPRLSPRRGAPRHFHPLSTMWCPHAAPHHEQCLISSHIVPTFASYEPPYSVPSPTHIIPHVIFLPCLIPHHGSRSLAAHCMALACRLEPPARPFVATWRTRFLGSPCVMPRARQLRATSFHVPH
ncbi:hypothetical protein GUJ93_ZPchr0006g41603 [Zizania palustris]|uniref:Uncharacterized protein n=1 Tax=Zizania palustris TaxID=103762 RepID=A0A8J5W2W0_ZIZPA|nr:hypothetical protein GUJ93_ZPchr0006g41603 [Zizania palustris]